MDIFYYKDKIVYSLIQIFYHNLVYFHYDKLHMLEDIILIFT